MYNPTDQTCQSTLMFGLEICAMEPSEKDDESAVKVSVCVTLQSLLYK